MDGEIDYNGPNWRDNPLEHTPPVRANLPKPAATILADDTYSYEDYLPTIRWMQAQGATDSMIEELLDLKLRPEDRKVWDLEDGDY